MWQIFRKLSRMNKWNTVKLNEGLINSYEATKNITITGQTCKDWCDALQWQEFVKS